jgi:pimeloyl-ACP methyl ester carboxylesterase
MRGVRLFLVPTWTELEWSIRPQLEDWAEVASYDPIRSDDPDAVSREMFVDRGLDELERLGWDGFFVVGDTFGTATAARIARARRDAVRGIALGHACVSWDMDGDRPPVKRELWAAMGQLMSRDAASFVRHGLTQITQGSYDEELANRMVERVPSGCMFAAWTMIGEHREPIGELLREIDRPLLLAKHKGCLVFTDEGFEDIRTAFPDARTVAVERPPSADEEFGHALREFCLQA